MYIQVQVVTGSKRESVEIAGTNAYGHAVYKIKTRAKPVDNEANKAVKDILATYLGIPGRNIVLAHGGTSRIKLYKVSDAT